MRLVTLVKGMLFAVFLATLGGATANASVQISINKISQRMTVSVDGVHRYTWKVSTGKFGYSTPSGSYRPFRMEPDHFSKEWDDAPMPHSIFFTQRGHAIHGSYHTRRLGSAVSHGCVRLAPSNAARLYSLVAREGMGNTTIVVTGGGVGGLGLVEEFAPIGREIKKLMPEVKKQFGDWLKETQR